MRKFHSESAAMPPRSKRSRVPAAVALGLVLVASPLLYELGQVVVGRWMSMAGVYRSSSTPILDAIAEWSRTADVDARRQFSGFFRGGTWSPSTAVPFAIGWALVMAVVFLRRVR